MTASFNPRWLARAALSVVLGIGALLAIALAMMLLFWSGATWAHDAEPTSSQPLGWRYPSSCCSGMDCRRIGDGQSSAPVKVYETADGYRFNTSKEIVGYSDPRVKESPDGEFHWCTVAGHDDGRTICLYVPPRAF